MDEHERWSNAILLAPWSVGFTWEDAELARAVQTRQRKRESDFGIQSRHNATICHRRESQTQNLPLLVSHHQAAAIVPIVYRVFRTENLLWDHRVQQDLT
jgi:hypothetical protein